jgi:outer membrane receptor for ferrienterochelin and colicin
MNKTKRSFVVCLLILLAAAPSAWPQTQITTGVIQGTIVDQSGAAVPGANVEVRNLDTNLARAVATNEDGRFVFLLLPTGRYTLTASKQGFSTLVQENLSLTVGQAITLALSMKVSPVQEVITVTATPVVDTIKTEASTTLNELAVSTLPVLGRKFEDLFTLTPGVSIVQGPDGDEITFAGQRGIFNNISLDGGDFNNGFFGEQAGGQRPAIDITLEAVKEFQVVATGASAEFGRTAGGVVNVITKSGTNEIHGSAFHFQRLEALTANTSTGEPLTDFHREQFGGTLGGPLVRDKAFLFGAFEQITANLTRSNLSVPIGSPCSTQTPTIQQNETLINNNTDCQRLALLNFFKTRLNQDEGQPVEHPIRNSAFLGKLDWNMTPKNQFSFSYNFARSRNENQTFDVATYGNSANGTEGPAKIQAFNFNLFSTLTPNIVNEGHFTYLRENRPRSATRSNVPADVAMGFVTTFRFGNPFFLQPGIDEIFWRTQAKDNVSIVSGKHTIKFGGEWIHSLNDQVFRGFFTGRYIFDSTAGFLRYASPASTGPGFGPQTVACSNGSYVTAPASCPAGSTPTGGPLLLYLQGAGRTGPATDAAGASNISNEDYALFIQDKWQIVPNFTLNYGLRWEAQVFPEPVVPPSQTAYGRFLSDPRFPSDGTLPDQKKQFQPRVGFAWDVAKNQKSVLRASWGIYNARQNMLTQVGSITTNGVQQQTIFVSTDLIRQFGVPAPVFPGVVAPTPLPAGRFPDFSGVRVFSKDYDNPRIYTTNVAFEQEIYPDWTVYVDFTHAKGVHLTRFVNVNNGSLPVTVPRDGNSVTYNGSSPFGPQLGEVMVTSSSAKSLYRGFTAGVRKRFGQGVQLEGNYVYSRDDDDDSNERDPFTDRTFNRFDFTRDYSPSDRDIRHKFNFYLYGELPRGFQANLRIQARSAQPITVDPSGSGSGAPCSASNSRTRVVAGVDCGRNHLRKNNEFFSFDWRLSRPFRFSDRYALTPMFEMFNTFNNDNNINPLITPGLFNFDGFLRQGVGDPLQVQIAVKFTF